MNLPKRLFRNVSWLTFGFQAANILQFVFFTALGRIFDKETVGDYQTAFTLVTFLSLFSNFGLSFYLLTELSKDTGSREGMNRARVSNDGIIGRVYALRFSSILLMAALGSAFVLLFQRDEPALYLWAVLWLGLHEVFFWSADVMLADFKAREEMHVPALLTVLLKLLTVVAAVSVLILWQDLPLALFSFAAAAFLYFLATLTLRIRRFGRPPLEFTGLTPVLAANLPFGLAFILNEALFKQEIFILDAVAETGREAVGLYTPTTKILFFFIGFSLALQEAILPALSQLWREDRAAMAEKAGKFLRVLLLISMPISAGLFIVAEDLMILWLGEEFRGSIPVLQWVAWTAVLAQAQAVYGSLLTIAGRQRLRTVVIGITLVAAVVANIFLVRAFGPHGEIGAGIGRVLTESLPLVLYLVLVARFIGGISLIREAWRPAVAVLAMILLCYVWTDWPMWLDILAGAATYVAVLALVGALRQSERRMFLQVLQKG